MTQDVERLNTTLSQYLQRGMPPELREGAFPPAGYIGDLGDWHTSQAVARREWIAQATVVFHHKVSAGWTEAELLSDEPIEVSGDGQPRRALPATVSTLAMVEAETAWRHLKGRGLSVEAVYEQALERAAGRSFSGSPEILAEAVRVALSVVDNYAREQQRKRGEAPTIPMRVVCGFTHPRTRHEYTLGIHHLTPREAMQIIEWKAKMEASFGGRASGPREAGYSPWPPCYIEGEEDLIEAQPSMWTSR